MDQILTYLTISGCILDLLKIYFKTASKVKLIITICLEFKKLSLVSNLNILEKYTFRFMNIVYNYN